MVLSDELLAVMGLHKDLKDVSEKRRDHLNCRVVCGADLVDRLHKLLSFIQRNDIVLQFVAQGQVLTTNCVCVICDQIEVSCLA